MKDELTTDSASRQQITGSLRSRVFRAGSWTILGSILRLAIQILGSLITTRLFYPEAFGLVAAATAIYVIISLASDVGLGLLAMQSANAEKRAFRDTLWTLRQIQGLLVWTVSGVLAVGVHLANSRGWIEPTSVYADPLFPAVIVVIGFASVIQALQSIKAWMAQRVLNIYRVTLFDLIAQIAGLAFVIIVGWSTHSIWAFITGGLVTSAVKSLLSHVSLPGPTDRLAWDREALREIIAFGKWLPLSSTASGLTNNGDRLLLAGMLNPSMLGYYSLASNISATVDSFAGQLFATVMMPALSESARQQPDRFSSIYFRIRWVLDTLILAGAGFLFATGQWIIHVLYDHRYEQAGWMLQWLSFGLIFSRYGIAQSAYLALGRTNYLAAINVVTLVSLFSLVPTLSFFFGVQGAIIAIVLHKMPSALLVFWVNREYGLNNFRLELGVLGAWPLGWMMGFILLAALNHF